MMKEFTETICECAEAIADLTSYSMEQEEGTIDECFPAAGIRFFQMDGKTYKLKMHCEVIEV